jgi:hypothetical protein
MHGNAHRFIIMHRNILENSIGYDKILSKNSRKFYPLTHTGENEMIWRLILVYVLVLVAGCAYAQGVTCDDNGNCTTIPGYPRGIPVDDNGNVSSGIILATPSTGSTNFVEFTGTAFNATTTTGISSTEIPISTITAAQPCPAKLKKSEPPSDDDDGSYFTHQHWHRE